MNKLLKNIDPLIPIITLILVAIGFLIITSATYDVSNSPWTNPFLIRQFIAFILGTTALIVSLFFDYRSLKNYSEIIYVCNILILLSVLMFGETAQGGQRWLVLGPIVFQPSELAKLAVIITLADLLATDKYNLDNIFGLLVPCLHILLPVALIFLQNDLGTSLVVIAIFLGIIYAAGANSKIFFGSIGGILATVITWITLHVNFDIPIPLQTYQLNRLLVLVNPALDPLGSGYNVIQSKIAIGGGGLFGQGLFSGTQNKLNFLPEMHTDFIFSVLGEEFGFIGVAVVLILYFVLLWQAMKVVAEAKDSFGVLIVIGIITMFAFHIFENVGMTLGIMPVTGITLPFLSYGGSSLITNMLAVGLILNVSMRKKKILF